jgi:hypothetical protein
MRTTNADEFPPYICRRHGSTEPLVTRTKRGYLHRRCKICLKERFDKNEWQRGYRAGERRQERRIYRRVTAADDYTCSKCGSHEFFHTAYRDGRIKRICVLCERARQRTSVKLYRAKVISEVIAAYGSQCLCCGESEPLFLSIDHVFNDGAAHRKERGAATIYRHLKALGFPKDRYRLLCFNCNLGRQRNGGICPHGGVKE